MDLFDNLKKWKNMSNALIFKCVNDIPRFCLIIYTKNLIKNYLLHW